MSSASPLLSSPSRSRPRFPARRRPENTLPSNEHHHFTHTGYDANGNLTTIEDPSSNVTSYTWDEENRRTKVELPSTEVVTSTYNGDGLRVKREDSSVTKKFIWDEQAYLAETDGSDVLQSVYTQRPAQFGGLASLRRLDGAVWSTDYFHYDALGSTVDITDSSETVQESYVYDTWGNLLTASTLEPAFLYVGDSGYYADWIEGSVLDYYVRARTYDPATARWLSLDPMGFVDGMNLYSYVANNSVMLTDVSGSTADAPKKGPLKVDCVHCPGKIVVGKGGIFNYKRGRVGGRQTLTFVPDGKFVGCGKKTGGKSCCCDQIGWIVAESNNWSSTKESIVDPRSRQLPYNSTNKEVKIDGADGFQVQYDGPAYSIARWGNLRYRESDMTSTASIGRFKVLFPAKTEVEFCVMCACKGGKIPVMMACVKTAYAITETRPFGLLRPKLVEPRKGLVGGVLFGLRKKAFQSFGFAFCTNPDPLPDNPDPKVNGN